MNAADFRRIALSLEGVEEGSHMGGGRLPCRRQDLRHARLESSGLRQFDDDTRTTGGLRTRVVRSVSGHSGRMGKDGHDPHLPSPSERGCAGRYSAHRMEAQGRKEHKGEEQEEKENCPGKLALLLLPPLCPARLLSSTDMQECGC